MWGKRLIFPLILSQNLRGNLAAKRGGHRHVECREDGLLRGQGNLSSRSSRARARFVGQRVSHDNSRHARGTEKQVDAFICGEMHKLHAARGFLG